MKPILELDQRSDIYMFQRRPSTGHFVINDEYAGLAILDPWHGAVVERAPFPQDFRGGGVVNGWCLRSDGLAVLVLNDSEKAACLLSLGAPVSQSCMEYPEISTAWNIFYSWDEDLWLADAQSKRCFHLKTDGNGAGLVEQPRARVLDRNPLWRLALERIPDEAVIRRIEPDMRRALFYQFHDAEHRVGMIGWQAEDETLVSIRYSESAPRLAVDGQCLVVLREYGIDWLHHDGSVRETVEPPTGYHFFHLNALPARANTHRCWRRLLDFLGHPSIAVSCYTSQSYKHAGSGTEEKTRYMICPDIEPTGSGLVITHNLTTILLWQDD